jgi:hypothetical protein
MRRRLMALRGGRMIQPGQIDAFGAGDVGMTVTQDIHAKQFGAAKAGLTCI